MQKSKQILVFILGALLVWTPGVAFAVIVPCDGLDCDVAKIFELMDNLTDFLLFTIAFPLGTIALAISGIYWIIGAANEANRTRAKEIFIDTLKGLVLAFAAWLIVKTILLGVGSSFDPSRIGPAPQT